MSFATTSSPEVESAARAALERGRAHLLSVQTPAGYWKAELETNVTMDAEDLMLRQFLGIRGERETKGAAAWIRSHQNAEGGWANYAGASSIGLILVALFLLFIPGVNLVAFFLVNGYLLGREFFEFAAMRYRTPAEARLFRAKHASTVLLAGFVIAAFLAVPIVNLMTPLFAAGLMVHLHKALSRKDPGFSLRQG